MLWQYITNAYNEPIHYNEYGHDNKVFELPVWWGIQWYSVFVDYSYYSQVAVSNKTLWVCIKHILYTKIYIALY